MLNCNGMDGATKGEFYIRKNERKKKKTSELQYDFIISIGDMPANWCFTAVCVCF